MRRHLRSTLRRAGTAPTPQKQLQLQNNRLRLKSELPASYADACASLETQRSRPLDEATYAVLIRSAVEAGDLRGAHDILERMTAHGVRRKRRCYAPLLAALAHAKATEEVSELWKRMQADEVKPDQMDLARLFCAAPADVLIRQIADDAAAEGAFDIGERTARVLSAGPWRSTYERVDTATGATSHGMLKRLALEKPDRAALREALLDRASHAGHQGAWGPKARRQVADFGARWDEKVLNDALRRRREGRKPAIRVCIDGANVAWYGQNYARGGFNHAQLDHAMTRLKELFDPDVYVPTLFLPRKHVRRLGARQKQLVAGWAPYLIDVPRGVDDDWFWMRATLSDADEHAFVVTNDAARDHHLAHVAPRAFRRWLRRHVLRFEFARDGDDAAALLESTGGQRAHGQRFVLGEPPAFSTECQQLGDAWLLPVASKHSRDWARRGRTWLALSRPTNCLLPRIHHRAAPSTRPTPRLHKCTSAARAPRP